MASVKSTKQVFLKDITAVGDVTADGTVHAKAQASSTTKAPILINTLTPPTIGTGAQSITIAQILTGILEEDPEGAAAWTLPTGTLAVAGVDGVQVGDCLDFTVINTDGTNDVAITITAAASGCTIVGNAEVESPDTTADAISSGSAMFRIRFTNVSDTPAYTCYRMA
tara:strand:+ start:267 stop:770 length:504 start_codon:yes stop_codon:yes gene_type:complete